MFPLDTSLVLRDSRPLGTRFRPQSSQQMMLSMGIAGTPWYPCVIVSQEYESLRVHVPPYPESHVLQLISLNAYSFESVNE